jgi:hypothetical protein
MTYDRNDPKQWRNARWLILSISRSSTCYCNTPSWRKTISSGPT